MKVVSWNVNGIRAAERKGFMAWLQDGDADVVFLQEIKALEEQLSDELRQPKGWHAEFFPAQRPGYSGVAVYSRDRPDEVTRGLGDPRFDDEGRSISARFGDLHLIGAYFPNGGRDLARVPFKLDFYATMLAHCNRLREQGLQVVTCGDWNTAHQEIDLARPKENQKTTGFLPEEREWVTRYLAAGWVDAWRQMRPGVRDRYSWWAPWQFARQKNIGWRIDYHVVDAGILGKVKDTGIHEDVPGSDHCPVSLDIAEGGTLRGTTISVTPSSGPSPTPSPAPATSPAKPPSAKRAASAKPSVTPKPPSASPKRSPRS